ncbi:hypothetical protein ACTXT7_008445 [Hymenolepis weldensis]
MFLQASFSPARFKDKERFSKIIIIGDMSWRIGHYARLSCQGPKARFPSVQIKSAEWPTAGWARIIKIENNIGQSFYSSLERGQVEVEAGGGNSGTSNSTTNAAEAAATADPTGCGSHKPETIQVPVILTSTT